MRLLAPAKLNLHLRVAPADGSGFHPLMSWFCAVGLFDTLTFTDADPGILSLDCDDPLLICDSTNLVLRAAYAVREQADRSSGHSGSDYRGVRIHLQKQIPIGAGLGGGSSDAARTLLGLNQIWNLRWPLERLMRIAGGLGSDVPFFLHGPSSICTGRGEIVRRIARPTPRWAVLILPDFAISTPAVYRKFDEMGLGTRNIENDEPFVPQWAELSAGPLMARLVNDLEAPAMALCPQLATLREAAEQALGRIVRMSGSGSSLFTIFDDRVAAEAAVACIYERCGVRSAVTELAPVNIKDDLTD